ncbi:MAG TPA: twin-arginine translocation signal domain-containing protein, partial [Puia sp.]|nr:twin-arginine translocation signal domain-containing protein [Puia sp.]
MQDIKSRRDFLKATAGIAGSTLLVPSFFRDPISAKPKKVGIQLYTVRNEMLMDPTGTLKRIAAIGFKELESARSDKGNYYGLKPKEIRK